MEFPGSVSSTDRAWFICNTSQSAHFLRNCMGILGCNQLGHKWADMI